MHQLFFNFVARQFFCKKSVEKFANPKILSTFVVPNGKRGISSVGRAFEWHSKGQEFDSPMLHKKRVQPGRLDFFCEAPAPSAL